MQLATWSVGRGSPASLQKPNAASLCHSQLQTVGGQLRPLISLLVGVMGCGLNASIYCGSSDLLLRSRERHRRRVHWHEQQWGVCLGLCQPRPSLLGQRTQCLRTPAFTSIDFRAGLPRNSNPEYGPVPCGCFSWRGGGKGAGGPVTQCPCQHGNLPVA